MTSDSMNVEASQPASGTRFDLFDNWFDPIEASIRDRVRTFIEEMIRGELDEFLGRPRYGRRHGTGAGGAAASRAADHRHGSRSRSLTGTFGPIEIAVPRARLEGADGKTTEWKSQALVPISAARWLLMR
jgi:putative transposase